MKTFKLFLALIIASGFSACSIVNTNYSFLHHGTETIKTDSDFKYVAFNVKGKAKTTYYPNKLRKKQETVKDGLIAEAKKNLQATTPLQNNQTYANLSIDILETIKAKPLGLTGMSSASAITIEVVISTDIIEYLK